MLPSRFITCLQQVIKKKQVMFFVGFPGRLEALFAHTTKAHAAGVTCTKQSQSRALNDVYAGHSQVKFSKSCGFPMHLRNQRAHRPATST